MSKTFLEKHAAAMVCHRQEFRASIDSCDSDGLVDAFDALADRADEIAAYADKLFRISVELGVGAEMLTALDREDMPASGLPGGIAAR